MPVRFRVAARFALASTLVAASAASAYPFMIRHDYASCATCHSDPSGGSQLTDYGRAQGELLLRMRYGAKPDEEPGKKAEFLFGALGELPEGLRLGGGLRTLTLLQATPAVPARFIPMQADVVAQYQSGRLRANVSLGVGRGPTTLPIALLGDNWQLVSRHHWVGLGLGEDDWVVVRAGRLPVPFGLRNPEHTQWVRSVTRTDTNVSSTHGASVTVMTEKLRGELMGIVGNLNVAPASYRERGYSGYLEYSPRVDLAFGASSLITHVETALVGQAPEWRQAHGAFARWSPHRLFVISGEANAVLFSQLGQRNRWGLVSLLSVDVEPVQGFHFVAATETWTARLGETGSSVGLWGTVWWFFAPHCDARVDVVWRKLADNPTAPTLQVMAQLHFFL